MLFMISLYTSLVIFGLGLLYKISTWFRHSFDSSQREYSFSERFTKVFKAVFLTFLSPKILTLLKIFVLDVLFQRRILSESYLRWIMHMCIYTGFMLLLFMHAFESFITSALFSDYSSTLNPFLFLRSLFGIIVIAGLGISIYRRHWLKTPRLMTNTMDRYVVIMLAIIMISGFLLEATKIISYSSYQTMVEDYADFDDDESLKALESYWVEDFGIVSSESKRPFDADILSEGRELHEMNCAYCHSRPQWAFLSYGLSVTMRPVAVGLDKMNIPDLLWYIHFLACFIGLAYLPFSRMFHVFTSPLSLLVNAVIDGEESDPAVIATKQMIELDACTHCGTCSTQCLMGFIFYEIGNKNILPSEKLASVKKLSSGSELSRDDVQCIQEGLYLCTNCTRCTLVCPAGINLQDIWFNAREAFLEKGYPEIYAISQLSSYRGLKRDCVDTANYQRPLESAVASINKEFKLFDSPDTPIDSDSLDKPFCKSLGFTAQSSTFNKCYACTTCTSSCPVVNNYENPGEILGMVPHQIIHAAVLGAPDMIYRSKMLWNCLGCYECQDACPQGVRVTDVFYELKNRAVMQIKKIPEDLDKVFTNNQLDMD